jgi:hypothetical protein
MSKNSVPFVVGRVHHAMSTSLSKQIEKKKASCTLTSGQTCLEVFVQANVGALCRFGSGHIVAVILGVTRVCKPKEDISSALFKFSLLLPFNARIKSLRATLLAEIVAGNFNF